MKQYLSWKLAAVVLMLSHTSWALERIPTQEELNIAPLETFVIMPVTATPISIWVPADAMGPFSIHCAFRKSSGISQCQLPANVEHIKSQECPDGVARVLGDTICLTQNKDLPLTLVNGWKWDFASPVSQYETYSYDLVGRDCWENSVEAIMTEIHGQTQGEWFAAEIATRKTTADPLPAMKSEITIRTFEKIRSRAGYPKQRSVEEVN